MSVISIDADFIVSRLNALPPHSRLRSGYYDLLREIRRREIEADVTELRQSAEIIGEVERVLAETDFSLRRPCRDEARAGGG